MNIHHILHQQKVFFATHKTKNVSYRIQQLEKLKSVLQEHEEMLYEAIHQDFGKSRFDTFTTEISLVLNDIEYFFKNLKRLSKPRKVATNLANIPGRSRIYFEPLGNVLVIGAWNYPYQLSLSPMVAAIAAGNTCIIKPSEVAANTMVAMAKIINENFDPELLHVAQGGVEETTEILQLKFDKIFFTGSTRVGKIVYEAAAKHLTPIVLELGGKSPAIVTESADFQIAAKRIVWGKFLNGGQTCVAPDYVLVNEKIKDKFLEYLRSYIQQFNYQPDSEHYTRIINEKNFDRLVQLIDPEKIYTGGNHDRSRLFIEPTILHNISWDDKMMEEEIFGPILPVLTYPYFREALTEIQSREKPLAAYLFTNKEDEKKLFTSLVSFGGGCINDVIMHLSNPHLPFGGVGNSGMGHYHGRFSFETFSHQKAVLHRKWWGEPNLKYPPYSENKLKWIKRLLG
ncbi:aldehyde dehydrogenase [Chryseobacterium lacus]|uniref:Aldehyde dehydrogenase n=1 Tax=Chryseobacterium lacus TaxID=2058346 RepID=A0A368MX63_9FLAO|nr:aldehyde dehydrogenase [Chryseobacterium lacus]RCU42812.1 aldehyde dehydrogenase [Chryseobacterium lacus]RST27377.1 aldehyde dehydrogenase [Chryseobacterium lacus]